MTISRKFYKNYKKLLKIFLIFIRYHIIIENRIFLIRESVHSLQNKKIQFAKYNAFIFYLINQTNYSK